jgi:hypothetical protein
MHLLLRRTFGAILALCITGPLIAARAQVVLDPNAVELSPFLIAVDSTPETDYLYPPQNLGDQNNDGIEDLYLRAQHTDDTGSTVTTNELGLLSVDGALTKLPLNVQNFLLAADIDGDGRKDLFDYVQGFEFRYLVHHASQMLQDNDTLRFANGDGRAILVDDLDEDGDPDLLTAYAASVGADQALYKGPVQLNTTLDADDSTSSPQPFYSYDLLTTVGRFLPDHRPRLLRVTSRDTGNWNWRLTAALYPPLSDVNSLWSATPQVVFQDSIKLDVFVYSTPSLVFDFTGDGLDDLIISDSAHVYVFAGGPDFGSRPLAKSEATLVLTSPALLDSAHYPDMTFPLWIEAAGDLTGTGVPYLAVGGWQSNKSTIFLYAGGAAIDLYADATITKASSSNVNFTPMKIGPARTAALLSVRTLDGSQLEYLHNGTDLIPHQQRSAVAERQAPFTSGIAIAYSPDGSAVIDAPGSRELSLYSTLGDCIARIELQSGRAILRPQSFAGGMYWLRTADNSAVAKLLLR